MNPHRPAEGSPEPLAKRPIVMALEYVPGARDQLFIALREQAHLAEHRGKYPRRVGAAAKSKDVDRISFLIVPHQESVSVGNVVREQPGDRKIEAGNDPALDASPNAWRRHCTDTGLVVAQLVVPRAIEHGVKLDHVGVDRRVLIAGAIKAQDDVPSHGCLSPRSDLPDSRTFLQKQTLV